MLHFSILQELARLETQEAMLEILDLLDEIMDGKLLPEEEDKPLCTRLPAMGP